MKNLFFLLYKRSEEFRLEAVLIVPAKSAPARLRKAFWAGLLSLLCAACSTPSSPPTQPALLYPEDIASALLTDETLARDIEIQDQSFVRGTDKVVLAQGFLFNKTKQPLVVEARTLFKNTKGETLETSPWKRILLPPGQQVSQAAPSINPQVTRYLLEIRRAK